MARKIGLLDTAGSPDRQPRGPNIMDAIRIAKESQDPKELRGLITNVASDLVLVTIAGNPHINMEIINLLISKEHATDAILKALFGNEVSTKYSIQILITKMRDALKRTK